MQIHKQLTKMQISENEYIHVFNYGSQLILRCENSKEKCFTKCSPIYFFILFVAFFIHFRIPSPYYISNLHSYLIRKPPYINTITVRGTFPIKT